MGVRPSLAAFKSEAPKRRPSLRAMLREREPQAPNGCILAARAAVILAGLCFVVVGIMVLAAGCLEPSWVSIVMGLLIESASLPLIWSGLPHNRSNTCNPTVVFVAEFFSRICG